MEGDLRENHSKEVMRRIIDKLHETISSVDKFPLRWEEMDKQFAYTSDLLEEKAMKVKLKEELLSERIVEVEERERKIKFLEETTIAKLSVLEAKEKEFDLKQVLETSIIRMALEMENEEVVKQLKAQEKKLGLLESSMSKKYEELMSELEARKDELSMAVERNQTAELERRRQEAEMMEQSHKQLEAREKEISSFCEAIKEKSAELKKKEENFQLKQKEIAKEIEMRSRNLELEEKKLEEKVKEFELKMREFEEQTIQQPVQAKRSRLEFEAGFSSLANKQLKEHSHGDEDKRSADGFSASVELCSLNEQNTDFASTSKHISQVNIGEINEIMDIDEDTEDSEPYDCPDPDFNDFNKTMNSFAVGQVWALFDPKDDMPRYYARIRNIFSSQLSLQVTWLEPVETTDDDESLPISCGKFRYGGTEIKNYLVFSHEMHHTDGYNTVILNPRKGETWALFRDWNTRKNNPSYMLDFVEVVLDFDDDLGVGVMYLGKVEGFVSVFKHGAQHGVVAFMISPEEMGRFSHRVPSVRLSGEVKEGVPDGSFELDPAAMPAYMHDDHFMLKHASGMEAQSKDCGKEA